MSSGSLWPALLPEFTAISCAPWSEEPDSPARPGASRPPSAARRFHSRPGPGLAVLVAFAIAVPLVLSMSHREGGAEADGKEMRKPKQETSTTRGPKTAAR